MPPCMKGRAASLEFLFFREKVPFACCVGEMGFALLYRGAGFCLRRAETGKAGMFRPFFVSCVESAKGWGWLYVEKVASGKHLFVLKRHFYERCALAKKGRYAIPGRKNLKEAIMSVQFLVHEDGDSVGVITVEGVKAGQELTGWIMKEDKTITFKVLDDIPIGHKIALKDLNVGDTVFKYGTDIGKDVKPIRQGEHLHVHNVKTKRW